MTTSMIISILAFFGVTAAGLIGAMFFREWSGSKSLETRLDRVTGHKTPTLESTGILKEPIDDGHGGALGVLLPRLPSLTTLFQQADFRLPPAQFWGLTAVMTLVGAAVPGIIGMPTWLMGLTAIIAGSLPFCYVLYLRKARMKKFASQLCEALELVARALRAGHSLASGMHVVAEEMPEPISSEFGRVWEEQNLGIGIEDAMRNLADRIPNLDLKFFVTAVIIQRQTGGDLSEILDKISYVIRERFKLLGMVQALTAEGRLSGVVLIALPIFVFLLLLKLNPEYISLLWTDQRGQYMAMAGIGMMIIGALVIRKIVNIKV